LAFVAPLVSIGMGLRPRQLALLRVTFYPEFHPHIDLVIDTKYYPAASEKDNQVLVAEPQITQTSESALSNQFALPGRNHQDLSRSKNIPLKNEHRYRQF
jgi:hypothetical protein